MSRSTVLLYDANGVPLVVGQAAMAASLPVAIASNQSTLPTQDVDRTATGNLTAAAQTVAVVGAGDGNVGLQITGTWVATLQFEGTIDGTNWFAMNAHAIGTTASLITSTTANGQWRLMSGGCVQVRVRCSAFTSGTAVVTLVASQATTASNAAVTSWFGSAGPTVGQKTLSNSIPVCLPTDQTAILVTFTGTRTGVVSSIVALGGATAGTLQIMRATVYTEPVSAAQRSVSSSSASDAAAGTGARTLRITYYDGAGAGPLTEDITLNGTTAVNTVATNIRFIESIAVLTVGSGGANVGTITLFGSTAGGGGTVGTIGIGNILTAVGDNRTLWAHHYVATAFTASLATLVVGAQSGGSGTSARFFVRSSQPLVTNTVELIVGDVLLVQGAFTRQFQFYPLVAGFARLTAYCIPAVNNATMSVSFDYSES